jgi:outer membrane protein TolC
MSKLIPILGLLCAMVCGCGDWSQMPTVPREKLRDVGALSLERAATQPALSSTTAPSHFTTTSPSRPEYRVSLEEARRVALENNLDLRVELLNPTIARQSINEEEARFESIFTTDVNYSVTDSPTANRTESSQAKALQVTPGVNVPLRTGGALRFAAPMTWLETNNEFSTLNPAYSSDVQASMSHPLLRGAGAYYAEQSIRIARFQYLQSEAQTKLAVISVLSTVDRVYWRLYAARQDLLVRKQEYDLAVAQLDRARRMVNAGAAAEVEVVRADSGVANSIEAVINAENVVRIGERDLKRILNKPGVEMGTPTVVVPTTTPKTLYYRIEPEQMASIALEKRMEMLEIELQIMEQSSNVKVARNGLLPLVNLTYTYGISGLGGQFDDAWSMVRDNDFNNHTVGLAVEVPIGNEAAKSRLRRALATRLQSLATKDQRIASIRQELFNAIDQLDTNWFRILATRKAVEAAQRVLDAEIRAFTQGLRTSTEVIDAQTKLADAQTAEIRALADYQIAQVDIAVATGTVLGQAKVLWEPAPEPLQ